MADAVEYIIGGVVALLALFTLSNSIFESYNVLATNNVTVNGTEYESYFALAPAGVEGAVGAVLTIFFILILWKFYKDA